MSKELPQPKQSEEVDLGQLFKLIGNSFDRFFKFIASIFIGIYNVFLLLLIHIYRRLVWYVAAIILGGVIGFIIDMNSNKLYGANMFIETNFNSARQVYENVKQFHQLARIDKDTLGLAQKLGVSTDEAAHLKGFYIEVDLDENNIAEMYSEFYKRLDSVSRLEMTYERYKNSLTAYNFPIHRIGVASTDKNIYKKIEQAFIKGISGNTYLNELAKVNNDILVRKDSVLKNQIQKTDSLVKEYLNIRINESKKVPIPGSGTNLYMGDAESSGASLMVDESKLLERRLFLEDRRRVLDSAIVKQKNVVNVLANFPQSGYDIREWYDKMKFLMPLVLFIVTLLVFTFIGLGKYLDKQSKL
jgi:hypothetical protein